MTIRLPTVVTIIETFILIPLIASSLFVFWSCDNSSSMGPLSLVSTTILYPLFYKECQRAMEKGTVKGISWRNLTAVVVSGTKGKVNDTCASEGYTLLFLSSTPSSHFPLFEFLLFSEPITLILHSLSLSFFLSYSCFRQTFYLPILSLSSLCLFPSYPLLYQLIFHAYLSFIITFSLLILSLYIQTVFSPFLFFFLLSSPVFHLIALYLSFLSSSLPFLHSL